MIVAMLADIGPAHLPHRNNPPPNGVATGRPGEVRRAVSDRIDSARAHTSRSTRPQPVGGLADHLAP